eukprot:jgi/Bigna1/82787/fgenesh1_pg.97_\
MSQGGKKKALNKFLANLNKRDSEDGKGSPFVQPSPRPFTSQARRGLESFRNARFMWREEPTHEKSKTLPKRGKVGKKFKMKIGGSLKMKGPMGLGALLAGGTPKGKIPKIAKPSDSTSDDAPDGEEAPELSRRRSSGEMTHLSKPKMVKRKRPKKKKFSSGNCLEMIKSDARTRKKVPGPPPKRVGKKQPPPPPGYKFANQSLFPAEARSWNEGEKEEIKTKLSADLSAGVFAPKEEEKSDEKDAKKDEKKEDAEWSELLAPDGSGLNYYLNNKSGELTWIKPDCFKTTEERKVAKQ